MAEMRVKEETPTRIVLERNPSSRTKWTEYVRNLATPPLLFFLIAIALSAFLSWSSETGAIVLQIALIIVVIIELFLVYVFVLDAADVNVTIDLNPQRATHIRKFLFVRISKKEVGLEKVSQVLIHCEEVGKHCKLLLESSSNSPFEVAFGMDMDFMTALGKKIGRLLNKKVVFRHTDMGNPISEYTI